MRSRCAVSRMVLALCALSLAGCPLASRKKPPADDPSDAAVVSRQPSDGAVGVGLNVVLSAVFDTDMDKSTFNADSFTLHSGDDEIDGTAACASDLRTVTFTPFDHLENETEYTAQIGTAVRDAAGRALAAPVEWSFTTVSADATAAPVFTPGEGVFEDDQVVALSSGTEDAVIYYEVTAGTVDSPPPDPAIPSISSTPYTAGIAVSGQRTVVKIRAIAVKSGLLPSAVSDGQFTVDASAFAARWGTAVWDLNKWNP